MPIWSLKHVAAWLSRIDCVGWYRHEDDSLSLRKYANIPSRHSERLRLTSGTILRGESWERTAQRMQGQSRGIGTRRAVTKIKVWRRSGLPYLCISKSDIIIITKIKPWVKRRSSPHKLKYNEDQFEVTKESFSCKWRQNLQRGVSRVTVVISLSWEDWQCQGWGAEFLPAGILVTDLEESSLANDHK